MQGSAPISGLSESSADSEESEAELTDNRELTDLSKLENIFITGVLDELKLSFNYNSQVGIERVLEFLLLLCIGTT